MFKLKNQLRPFVPLIAGLVILTLFTTLGGLWHYQNDLAGQTLSAQISGKNIKTTTQNVSAKAAAAKLNQGLAAASQKPSGTGQTAANNLAQGSNGPATATVSGATADQSTSTASQPATVSVALSVNGQVRGTVKMAAGGSQCDLLSQALAEGLINSLNMRYSSQYGTEAVYVIDGIGDPDTIWWTYSVNGAPPPYGCAYMTAHNGDSVNWQYVKS